MNAPLHPLAQTVGTRQTRLGRGRLPMATLLLTSLGASGGRAAFGPILRLYPPA